jgi:hypothetical protein
MLLFKLTVFVLLSDRSAGSNSSPTHCLKAHLHLRVKLVFDFVHILSLQTPEKSTKTFQTKRSKCVAGNNQSPTLLSLFKRTH